MKTVAEQAEVKWGDRIATAFVSFFAAIGTIVFVAVVGLVYGGADFERENWAAFGWVSAAAVLIAPVLGFVVGPERAAHMWGILWGTEGPRMLGAVVITLVIVVICGAVLLKYFHG